MTETPNLHLKVPEMTDKVTESIEQAFNNFTVIDTAIKDTNDRIDTAIDTLRDETNDMIDGVNEDIVAVNLRIDEVMTKDDFEYKSMPESVQIGSLNVQDKVIPITAPVVSDTVSGLMTPELVEKLNAVDLDRVDAIEEHLDSIEESFTGLNGFVERVEAVNDATMSADRRIGSLEQRMDIESHYTSRIVRDTLWQSGDKYVSVLADQSFKLNVKDISDYSFVVFEIPGFSNVQIYVPDILETYHQTPSVVSNVQKSYKSWYVKTITNADTGVKSTTWYYLVLYVRNNCDRFNPSTSVTFADGSFALGGYLSVRRSYTYEDDPNEPTTVNENDPAINSYTLPTAIYGYKYVLTES